MILCLDVGNSQIHGGVYEGDHLKLQFRKTSIAGGSSDEFGLFLKSVLRENNVDPNSIQQIALCTVVPELLHSINNCSKKYFGITPFILQAGVKTGLNIKYRNPLEVGADRIANAIAATHIFPNKNLVIVDFGTATTFCAINDKKDYLGGTIMAGLKISMEALESKTSKLPSVEIVPCKQSFGRSTVESIQAGLFYGNLGAIKEIIEHIRVDCFAGEKPLVIGTGGFASLFQKAYENKIFSTPLFNHVDSTLVLRGVYLALKLNI